MKYFPPKFYHQKGVQFICAFSLCAGDIYDHFNVLLSLIYLFEQEKFEVIIRASRAFSDDTGGVEKLWKDCGDAIYSLEPRLRSLGLGSEVCLSPLIRASDRMREKTQNHVGKNMNLCGNLLWSRYSPHQVVK